MKQVTYDLQASEFAWNLSENRTITALGFNNQLPGPVLKANKGDELIVRFKNNLHEPTLIHWHGIRLPASMDGTGEVQSPVQPGDTFEYRFVVPDAGTFWYHSHHNETVQVERGMYGALIVTDENDPVTDNDRVFLIDDMKLNAKNEFTTPGNALTRLIERHDGREGNTLLVNGKENAVIEIHGGQIERWRFVNTSNARYITLTFGGKPVKIIGTDGGLLEAAEVTTQVLLTPGERVDVLAGPFAAGEQFAVESLPYNRMTFLKARKHTYATVKVMEHKPSVAIIPDILRSIEPLAPADAPITRKVKLSVGPSLSEGLKFQVNNAVHTTDAPVYVDELQVWEVHNTSLMDHPFHLHGFFFQVLQVNGEAPAYRSWKDTINVPPLAKIKIAWMPDNRPGLWMYHCHILEHHAAGMMAGFAVIDPSRPQEEVEKLQLHMHHCSTEKV